MQRLVVTYGRLSFTRIEPQGASPEKWAKHICFMEINFLLAMSNYDMRASMLSLKFFSYSK